MNDLPKFENPGVAELVTAPIKGLLNICRDHYYPDLREAISHCQLAPLKHASRLDILASAVWRKVYLRQ